MWPCRVSCLLSLLALAGRSLLVSSAQLLTMESPTSKGVYNSSRVDVLLTLSPQLLLPGLDGRMQVVLDHDQLVAENASTTQPLQLEGLNNGRHHLSVTFHLPNGAQVAAASSSFRVRAKRSRIVVLNPLPSSVTTRSPSTPVQFRVDEFNMPYDGVVRVTLDGRGQGPSASSPVYTRHNFTLPTVCNGLHRLRFDLVDRKGVLVPGPGTTVEVPFRVQAPSGRVRIVSPRPGDVVAGTTLELTYRVDRGTFQVPKDGFVYVSVNNGTHEQLVTEPGPVQVHGIPPGNVTVDVMLVDINQYPLPDPTWSRKACRKNLFPVSLTKRKRIMRGSASDHVAFTLEGEDEEDEEDEDEDDTEGGDLVVIGGRGRRAPTPPLTPPRTLLERKQKPATPLTEELRSTLDAMKRERGRKGGRPSTMPSGAAMASLFASASEIIDVGHLGDSKVIKSEPPAKPKVPMDATEVVCRLSHSTEGKKATSFASGDVTLEDVARRAEQLYGRPVRHLVDMYGYTIAPDERLGTFAAGGAHGSSDHGAKASVSLTVVFMQNGPAKQTEEATPSTSQCHPGGGGGEECARR